MLLWEKCKFSAGLAPSSYLKPLSFGFEPDVVASTGKEWLDTNRANKINIKNMVQE